MLQGMDGTVRRFGAAKIGVEVLLGLLALGFDSSELLAQVTVVVAALLGFGFPLVSAMCDFGKLTHRVRSLISRQGDRAWEGGKMAMLG